MVCRSIAAGIRSGSCYTVHLAELSICRHTRGEKEGVDKELLVDVSS